jgi:hypothetical protein
VVFLSVLCLVVWYGGVKLLPQHKTPRRTQSFTKIPSLSSKHDAYLEKRSFKAIKESDSIIWL